MSDDEESYPGRPSIPRFRPATKPKAAPPQRRGFNQPGRTRLERDAALPVRRQIKALLNNPTPSPAEQARLQELTGTRSLKAALTAAKKILATPAEPGPPDPEATPDRERRNPGRRHT